MAPLAVVVVLALVSPGGPARQLPVPPVATPTQVPAAQDSTLFHCDPDGKITCTIQQTETVTGARSVEDLRIIGKYIQLISERNRRHYLAWQAKAPAAAYELVKRVKSFPYLPYGDTYAIVGLEITLNQAEDRVTVSYLKKPKQNLAAPVRSEDLATYSTKLSTFIKGLEQEIEKLKKYEKVPDPAI